MHYSKNVSCRVGTANKILAAKEKEREKGDKGQSKEKPRKKAKRCANLELYTNCIGLRVSFKKGHLL